MNEEKDTNKGVIVAVIIAVVLGVIAFTGTEDTETDTSYSSYTSEEETQSKEPLEIVESHTCYSDYTTSICGTVKNNSYRTYGYAQVEVNLYGSDGSLIGSTLDNINNLGSGETWKFKAPVLEDGFSSYKIKDVTGF